MPKTYSKQAESGEAGIALIHRRVVAMGFIWHTRQIDHGVDGEIELVDTEKRRPLNRAILVQSKVQRRFPGEDDAQFHFVCDPSDVSYWAEANVPVILVCSHPGSDEAWWFPVSQWFRDAGHRKTRRLDFDKRRDRFDESAVRGLLDLAVPLSDSVYLSPVRRPESLVSNLIRVEAVSSTIWAAPAMAADNAEAWELLRRRHQYASDWMIVDRTVYSFRRLDEEPLRHIADGVPEAIDTTEWSDAKSPDVQRRFVRLLNQTLGEMHHGNLKRHPKRHYLYFRPTDDLLPRRLSTGKSRGGRLVFRGYPDAHDPEHAKHYRHHALAHQFVRLDDNWFLELSPTYHFSFDGYRDLPWGHELVKGMKRRERNTAVRDLVEMWATYLAPGPDLFRDETLLPIRFGPLESIDIDFGIDEAAWRATMASFELSTGGTSTLFDTTP